MLNYNQNRNNLYQLARKKMLTSQTHCARFSRAQAPLQEVQFGLQKELNDILKLIFKGLQVSQQGKQKKPISEVDSDAAKGISREIFTKFSELPSLVALALFRAFDPLQQGVLPQMAFVAGFSQLIFGNIEEKLQLVFKMLQLPNRNQDNSIREKDCKTLLYHVCISCGCYISTHQNKRRIGRPDRLLVQQADIDNAIESLFSGCSTNEGERKIGRTLSFDKFCKFSLIRESDIPTLLLSFLYDKIRLVPMLNNYLRPQAARGLPLKPGSQQSNSHLLESPQFYLLHQLARVRYLQNIRPISKLFSSRIIQSPRELKSIYAWEKSKSLDTPPIEDSLLSQLGVKERKKGSSDCDPLSKWKNAFLKRKEDEQTRHQAWHSGHVYRFVDKNKIRLFWYELRGSELYFFNKLQSPTPKMIIPLREGFLLENKEKLALSPREHSDQRFTSFDLVFPSGFKKEFIFDNMEEKMEWMDALKEVIGHFDFQEDYQITSPAQSLPGQISLNGFSYLNGESLLLTQIPKQGDASLSLHQQHLYQQNLKASVEVLRICEHPLLPRVIEIKETANYVYIAREPCYGGSLRSYIEQTVLTPRLTRHIISQMTEILCFLKLMNVTVGNLSLDSFSLENEIAPSDSRTLPQLRLTNLRESRVISNIDGNQEYSFPATFGSAPQVLQQREQIGFEADAFSFGVTLCDLLFEKLPFASFKEILQAEPDIPQQECSLGPNICKNIRKLLVRDPRQRGTIEGFSRLIQFMN